MKKSLFFLLLPLFTLSPLLLFAQNNKQLIKEGETYFIQGRYQQALELFEAAKKIAPLDQEVSLKLGVSYFEKNNLDAATDIFASLSRFENNTGTEATKYLAQTYHQAQKFEEAIKQYKAYLKKTPLKNPDREAVKDEVLRCAFGARLLYQPKLALAENLGDFVNTEWHDFAPILSPNYDDKLYFASNRPGSTGGLRNDEGKEDANGHYNSDMYSTESISGKWQSPVPLNSLLNSPSNDMILDFNQDGQVIFFFKGLTRYSGEIFVDTFKANAEEELFPDKFLSPVIPEQADKDIFIFQDTVLFFSSDRPEGYGGMDIYFTLFQNGRWQAPKNLGPEINSAYDERCPFLSRNGLALYFSTNNPRKSMGGFDVVRALFDPDQKKWSEAENLGLPINSAADDLYFRLAPDGIKAYFSSDRKDGIGGEDILLALFKTAQEHQLEKQSGLAFWEQENMNLVTNTTSLINSSDNISVSSLESLSLEPLYYKEEAILTERNKAKLDQLLAYLRNRPGTSIALLCHSDDLENPEKYDLYFSVKRAEKAVEYLIQQGFSAERCHIQGCGSAYPTAKSAINGQPNPAGLQLNRRISVHIRHELGSNDINSFELIQPEMNAFMMRPEWYGFEEAIKEITYRIEVAQSTGILNDDFYGGLPDPLVERRGDDANFHYMTGLFTKYSVAQTLLNDLQAKAYTNCRIIPYYGGIRLTKEEVPSYLTQYPDLLNWMAGQ